MFKQKEVMKFDGAIISRELLEEIRYCDYVYAICTSTKKKINDLYIENYHLLRKLEEYKK